MISKPPVSTASPSPKTPANSSPSPLTALSSTTPPPPPANATSQEWDWVPCLCTHKHALSYLRPSALICGSFPPPRADYHHINNVRAPQRETHPHPPPLRP